MNAVSIHGNEATPRVGIILPDVSYITTSIVSNGTPSVPRVGNETTANLFGMSNVTLWLVFSFICSSSSCFSANVVRLAVPGSPGCGPPVPLVALLPPVGSTTIGIGSVTSAL
uniref:Uncharacterized protein n=1 Tax=Amphimedon queenslandica TaxID=400682 RepID=A0A1X7VVN3_AMPQE